MQFKVIKSFHSHKSHQYEIEMLDGNFDEKSFVDGINVAMPSIANYYLDGVVEHTIL